MCKQSRRVFWMELTALLVGVTIVGPFELRRLLSDGLAEALFGINVDTTPYILLFLVLPLCLWFRRDTTRSRWFQILREWLADSPRAPDASSRTSRTRAALLALFVGLCSLGGSAGLGNRSVGARSGLTFQDLPPAFHDEYSYLFQAKTFLAGRLSYPSHPTAPRLFDQMHVLNEGRFASRYFPGVGMWIVPFLAIGHPCWGHWMAGAIIAVLVFGIGRELQNNGAGLLAGVLTALAPGMALFSNLLLSHHPTLVGLSLFMFCFFRMQRTGRIADALLSGTGLSYAMLCRPMTAFGIGLPFGLVVAWSLLRSAYGSRKSASVLDAVPRENSFRRHCLRALALATPLAVGLAILYGYDRAITGNGLTTPYQLYTDIYTPRHVYGFDNVIRGERNLGPRVLDNYDRWAKNLTPELAARNVGNRVLAGCQWTLGIVPLAMAFVVFAGTGSGQDKRWWLILAAILSLHAVHIPYWYDGIMHWHYVFESGPLLLLVLASATQTFVRDVNQRNRSWLVTWWGAVIGAAVFVNWVSFPPFWSPSRVEAGLNELAFARQKYYAFQETIRRSVTEKPAIVLIEPDPSDRHIDFVVNAPSLDAEILLGRFRPSGPRSPRTNSQKLRVNSLTEAATYSAQRLGRSSESIDNCRGFQSS